MLVQFVCAPAALHAASTLAVVPGDCSECSQLIPAALTLHSRQSQCVVG